MTVPSRNTFPRVIVDGAVRNSRADNAAGAPKRVQGQRCVSTVGLRQELTRWRKQHGSNATTATTCSGENMFKSITSFPAKVSTAFGDVITTAQTWNVFASTAIYRLLQSRERKD